MKRDKNSMHNNTQSEIIIYQAEDGSTKIDVKFEQETVWLTQQQMADLFQTSRTNVVEHIGHIYEECELVKKQPVGNSDRFEKKEIARYRGRYPTIILI